jgi:hypothetical protein
VAAFTVAESNYNECMESMVNELIGACDNLALEVTRASQAAMEACSIEEE